MIDSVAGAVVEPRPIPRHSICPTISSWGGEADAIDVQEKPMAISSSPPTHGGSCDPSCRQKPRRVASDTAWRTLYGR